MTRFIESVVEDASFVWMQDTGSQVAHGPEIAPNMPARELTHFGEVILARRLLDALCRLNSELSSGVRVLDSERFIGETA